MVRRAVAWLEMDALFTLLYVGVPFVGLQLDRLIGIAPWPEPIPWLGFGLSLAGVAGLLWCFVLFLRVGRGTPNPMLPPVALVTVGPFAWTRNPIALSHAAALLGLSMLVGSISAAMVVVLLAPPVHVAMVREERTLEARFGDEYRAYKAAVPRWIPRRPSRRQS